MPDFFAQNDLIIISKAILQIKKEINSNHFAAVPSDDVWRSCEFVLNIG